MSQPRVGVLDYGSGNLHSVCRALEVGGAEVSLSADRDELASADGLVVPGVGAFAACMASLRAAGGAEIVSDALAAGLPVLGICVGQQVMFTRGVEHGLDTPGLAVLPGTVEQLPAARLPHMGWNTVVIPGKPLGVLAGVEDERFYFVHSYGVLADSANLPSDADVATATHEGATFIAALTWRSLTTTQFHPEKSGAAGARLLGNWLATLH